jgi:hypothetical protein
MNMKSFCRLSTLVLAAGLAAPAFAQDSVSQFGSGLAGGGDALDPFNTSSQRANYVTTLTPFTTSWGTQFGVAPIAKSSKACTSFFNNIISAQAHSATLLSGFDASATNFKVWSGAGFGVNPTANTAVTTTVSGPENSIRFGVAFNETAGSTACQTGGSQQDNVITTLVNFDPADRKTLYVSRIVAGVNKPTNVGAQSAGTAIGGVDAFGNTAVRVDNFNSAGAGAFPAGSHILRVRAQDRSTSAINQFISPAGGTNATDYIINSTVTHNTPSILGADLNGSRSVVLTTNFNREYRYESTIVTGTTGTNGNVQATVAHRAGLADHRGGMAVSKVNLFGGNAVATGTMLGRTGNGDTFMTDLLVWGIDATGGVTSARTLSRPASVSDSCDQFTATNWYFDGYHSQTAFQGGNGQSTVGQDKAGRGLVAGVLWDRDTWSNFNPLSETVFANPFNAIAVGRFDPANAASGSEWALAAWVNFDLTTRTSTGKPILDGPGGTAIGRLCSFLEVHQNPARLLQYGPNFSMPVFDSAGNIWFVSFVELFNRLPGGGSDFDSALIRAVYNPDTFCYELEKVMELGDIFQGQESGLNYRLNFMEIVDGDGTAGSGSSNGSGAMYSSNGTQAAWANNTNAGFPERFPQNLGGLVMNVSLTYDVNGDEAFEEGTADETYNALLYIANIKPCPGDTNADGIVDFGDFLTFFNGFDNDDANLADTDGDGFVSFGDFLQFFNSFDVGC